MKLKSSLSCIQDSVKVFLDLRTDSEENINLRILFMITKKPLN